MASKLLARGPKVEDFGGCIAQPFRVISEPLRRGLCTAHRVAEAIGL